MDAILLSFAVLSAVVKVFVVKHYKRVSWHGGKMFHLFATEKRASENRRNVHGEMIYVNAFDTDHDFTADQLGNALTKCTRFDVKHDGTCSALVWNAVKKVYELYARIDIKKKNGAFVKGKDFTDAWIPCEEMPTHPDATHWTHLRPVTEEPKMYKFYIEAYTRSLQQIKQMSHDVYGDIVSVEVMGQKINAKKSDFVREHSIIVHGSCRLEIPEELRNFSGFRAVFEAFPLIEGIVCYLEIDGQTVLTKVRRDTFGMKWGDDDPACMERDGVEFVTYKCGSISECVDIITLAKYPDA
ncbi:MAG: hypothetical protein FJ267_18885, partial [Planctomycetes bacterium]|nr:hypothetical protein [Planctomycetota bacterium]